MHQIYSCSDENLEVFTVISSKCEYIKRTVGDGGVGVMPKVAGVSPASGAARHVGITEQESSKSYNHLLDGKSLIPPSPVAHITVKAVAVTGSPTRDRTSMEDHRQRWRKTTEYDLALPPGAEASLPLTGGNLCGTPSLLRKMWMKHKKKSEYLGATNSAFEAD
ncbi:vexin [Pyrgilauda ruficollis]|uniref:vexin n=1 Tax=Pyrgilauda ruficollis TaxID=221976 RepID=UPI001B8633BC|nr:vexin [Pyrgilauda ruficollis]